MQEKWIIRQEKAKCDGKEVDIWYVGPKSQVYGYGSFTDEKTARQFLKGINEELETVES